jgi:chromate reductase
MAYKLGYIVGSLAAQSINRRLSTALIALAPSELELVEIPIKDLPLYNRDFDADYPPGGRALKKPSPQSTRCCSLHRSTTDPSPVR